MADFNCPTCESEETQSVVAIVDAETHHGTGTFFGRGRTRAQNGDYADTHISGSSSDVSRSQLAISLGPPEKRNWFLKALIVAGLIYFQFDQFAYAYSVLTEYALDWVTLYDRLRMMVDGAIERDDYIFLGTLAGCLILAPLSIRNFLYNIIEYDKDYIDWSNRWYCHRCGSIFTP